MSVEPDTSARGGIHPLLVVPLVLLALLVGYLIASASRNDPAAGGDAEVASASRVTRDSGDSVIRSHDGSGSVNLRSCPGLPTTGQTTGCDIVDRLPDGTLVTMECWIDSGRVPDRADTDRRWFLVTPAAGAPHPGRRGYVFSAEIPVAEQTRTPECDNDLVNELFGEPEPSTPAPAPPASSAPPPPATSAPASPPDPGPTGTPTSEPPAPHVTVTVENEVTNGPTQMREDTEHPAYLSTRPQTYCKDRQPACNVPGDLAPGDRLTALCRTTGDRVTNGQDDDTVDDSNRGLDESTLWYRLRADDGRTGYLSVIWLTDGDRDGLGLPAC
ncbi:hypothetical protein [Streptomyces glaucescens]|uniref:Putative thiopeptide-lantipeptide biosynthesis related protein n=1 Tax=Streptomyces glaucescens TaxID=1907 RepID=A0A089X333_STRGA|nr:hypothetical protein [Streptomyces glaucescens]AIR96186.1 putative thiopeptide-lantipeptide biosynthesis related protein [Streptomyces glaucescens]